MSLLADQQTENLRRFIINENALVVLDAFPQKDDPKRRIFYEAKLPTCVVVLERGMHECYHTSLKVHPGRRLDEITGSVDLSKTELQLCQSLFGGIPLVSNNIEVQLVLKLHTLPHFEDLGNVLQTHQGEINATTHREFLSEDPSVGPRVYRGGNVQRYEFIEEAKQGAVLYIRGKDFRREYGGAKAEHITKKRFGYQRKAALDNWRRLIFCELPDPPCYCIESISYFLYEGRQSYFLLSLLNSELLEWRFEMTSTNNMVSTSEISALPLRTINFTTPQAERERLTADLIARYERGEHQALLAEVEALLPKTADGDFLAFQPDATGAEEKSDIVHDLLAHLAEQMMMMHKQKQERVAAFWADLETATDASIFDTLRNKGKWEQSLAKDPACRPYVDRESRSTRHLDDSLGWDRDCYEAFVGLLVGRTAVTPPMLDVYRAHHAAYKALVARIASTDALIDQIVYRLYGLTEEEIAVVENDL